MKRDAFYWLRTPEQTKTWTRELIRAWNLRQTRRQAKLDRHRRMRSVRRRNRLT